MIRIARLTDYGIVLLTHVARDAASPIHNARDLAAEANLPLPTVSKILKALVRAGLLVSHRGVSGGYGLARPAGAITVADIIAALEGPIAMTDCIGDAHGLCNLEPVCPTQGNWRKINAAVRRALEDLTLADMTHPAPPPGEAPLILLRAAPLAGARPNL